MGGSRLDRLQARLEARKAKKESTVRDGGGRFSIVIVDDEQPNLDALVRALSELYDVAAFNNPQEALSAIAKGRCPDLIVSDQRMPEMTGVDLLREVGKVHPNCVGFILSGFTERADLLGAINHAPVVGYVTKPWKLDELLETVEQAIRISQRKAAEQTLKTELASLRGEIRSLKTELLGLTRAASEGAAVDRDRVSAIQVRMGEVSQVIGKLTKTAAPEAMTLKGASGPPVGHG